MGGPSAPFVTSQTLPNSVFSFCHMSDFDKPAAQPTRGSAGLAGSLLANTGRDDDTHRRGSFKSRGRLASNPEHTRPNMTTQGRDQNHVGSAARVLNLSPPLPPPALGDPPSHPHPPGSVARQWRLCARLAQHSAVSFTRPVLKPLNR